jgi:ABC-type lipoprotein export system ATPase subunit
MVTHDKRMADMTDRIIRIFDGRQVAWIVVNDE